MLNKDFHVEIPVPVYREYREDYVGLCTSCGAERYQTEPDARNYPCEACGKKDVYGIEDLLVMGMVEITLSKREEDLDG